MTLNPAIDKTLSIPRFAAGQTNRATIERIEAGGKGINVARTLRQFGRPVKALGFLAGGNGRMIADRLAAEGIPADFIWAPGDTRVNVKIKDPLAGNETEINEPGFPVSEEQLRALAKKIEEVAGHCAVMVFSGSLPPGLEAGAYARLLRVASRCGARTVLDTSGSALRHGLAAAPDLVKPNRAEAEEALGMRLDSEDAIVAAALRFLDLGAGTAVISLGPEGALAAAGNQLWRAHPPAIAASGSVGAGDAMVAALALSMAEGARLGDALRLAVAAGAAAAQSGGPATEVECIRDLERRAVLREITR